MCTALGNTSVEQKLKNTYLNGAYILMRKQRFREIVPNTNTLYSKRNSHSFTLNSKQQVKRADGRTSLGIF